jgi:hypothetical protein
MKTVPLSVRVSDDDAAFLAGLEIGDAHTPSEKLRALLTAERRRQGGGDDPVEAAEMFHDLFSRAKQRVRRMEEESGIRSDFVTKLYGRLPEIAGTAYVGPEVKGRHSQGADLAAFEVRLADRTFSLVQELLEIGLTTANRRYDAKAIDKKLAPIFEILELIKFAQEKRKGDSNG